MPSVNLPANSQIDITYNLEAAASSLKFCQMHAASCSEEAKRTPLFGLSLFLLPLATLLLGLEGILYSAAGLSCLACYEVGTLLSGISQGSCTGADSFSRLPL